MSLVSQMGRLDLVIDTPSVVEQPTRWIEWNRLSEGHSDGSEWLAGPANMPAL